MYVRNRFFYTVIIGVIIVVGLASRSDWAAETWPRFIVDYAGDT
jgi:hypothetical protein